jgi:hypothetical protein
MLAQVLTVVGGDHQPIPIVEPTGGVQALEHQAQGTVGA